MVSELISGTRITTSLHCCCAIVVSRLQAFPHDHVVKEIYIFARNLKNLSVYELFRNSACNSTSWNSPEADPDKGELSDDYETKFAITGGARRRFDRRFSGRLCGSQPEQLQYGHSNDRQDYAGDVYGCVKPANHRVGQRDIG